MSAPQLPNLVVGLGNPGAEYEATRHNVGLMVVRRLLATLPRVTSSEHSCNSWVATCRLGGREVRIQQPLTYMNVSGEAVACAARRFCYRAEDILLVYDDLDLPLGRIRLRTRGRSGGHRGVESVISELGSSSFARLRVGIGRARSAGVVDHVLSAFDSDEQPVLESVLSCAVDATLLALRRGVEQAMNTYNSMVVEDDNLNVGEAEC